MWAQNTDVELWSELSFKYAFNKKNEISLSQSLRLEQNASTMDVLFSHLNYKRNLNKIISLSAAYRFMRKPKKLGHRIYCNLSFSHKISSLQASYRFRYVYDFSEWQRPTHSIRNRALLKYKKKKSPLQCYAFVELFYDYEYNYANFSSYRLGGGVEYKLNKTHSLASRVFRQATIYTPTEKQANIFEISYQLDLSPKEKSSDSSTKP